MSSFTTRVELHGASGADYEKLHEFMRQAGFYRAVQGGDGKIYKMPTAEYDISLERTSSQVCDLAAEAAARTGKKYWVFVTEVASRAWRTERV